MNAPRPVPTLSSMVLIAQGVGLELLRLKDLYVLFILMGLYVVAALVVKVVGIENAATGAFLLNLGMTLASILAHILTLLLAARQIPNEIENRTLHPLLARPIDRSVYFAGKWAACTLCGAGAFAVLALIGWLPAPKAPGYDAAMLVQAFLLQAASLGVLAALALTLSLMTARGIPIVLGGLWYVAGDKVVAFAAAHAADGPLAGATKWLLAYLPQFGKMNVITRYTDGIAALGAAEFLGLLLYGAVFTAAILAAGAWVLRRKPL